MIDIRAVTKVLSKKSVCIMHLIIALKFEEFYFFLTHCIKLTKNHENKFANSIKCFFPTHVRMFVLKQSIYSENTHIYLF